MTAPTPPLTDAAYVAHVNAWHIPGLRATINGGNVELHLQGVSRYTGRLLAPFVVRCEGMNAGEVKK